MGRVFALLLLITAIGGITPIGARMAVGELPPMTLAWVRFGTAGTLLWLTLRLRGRHLPFQRRDLPRLLGLAVLCVPVNQFGFLFGVKYANASHAALFYALAPVVVFWLSVLLRRVAFSGLMFLAAGLAVAGAVCVISPSFGQTNGAGLGEFFVGDVCLLLAVTSWSTFIVLSTPLIRQFGALTTLTAVFLLGATLHTPLVLVDVSRLDLASVTWRGWSGFAFITLGTSYLNYLLFYVVLARYEATRALIVVNGAFVVTVVVEWLAFGERLTGWFFLGAGLIVAAIALDVLRGVRR